MIVLDTSFVVAFHNAGDVHHAAASDTMERLLADTWGRAILPEYVFVEVMTVLAARRDLATATRVGQTLLAARDLELVPCWSLFLDVFETFRAQAKGKRRQLSFTDAAIVAIARQRGAEHIATFDPDFRIVPGVTVVP
jgi:predicted nucleic acid-binding protein